MAKKPVKVVFGGWIVNGKVQMEPPPEALEKFDKALRKVFGITMFPDRHYDDDEQRPAG